MSQPEPRNPARSATERTLVARAFARSALGCLRAPAWLVVLLCLAALLIRSLSGQTNVAPFRLAFTTSMFTDVNEADARAAMKVWIMTVAKERGIPVDPNPVVYSTAEELLHACQTNPVDGVGVLAHEFTRLNREMKFDRLAVPVHNGRVRDEYVLLVHRDSGLTRLEQLEGRSLNVLHSPRTSLAPIWLDNVLIESGLKRVSGFFGHVKLINKASRVALPVFFRQTDACLTTRGSFEVMGELNPQLKTQLRVLAASPEMVCAGFAFRDYYRSPLRLRILSEMTRLGETPAGQQILALTQADGIVEQPVTCMDSALELIATHERLTGETNLSITVTGDTSSKPEQEGGR